MAKIFSYPEKAPSMPWATHPIPLRNEYGLKSPPCVFPHDNQEFPAFIGNSFPFDMTYYLIVSLGFFIQAYLILYALLYFVDIIFLIDGRFVSTMCSSKSYQCHFSNRVSSPCLSVTFWEFLQYFKVFVIIIFVTVVHDQ